VAKQVARCGDKALFDLRLVDFSVLTPNESTSHNVQLRRFHLHPPDGGPGFG